MSAPPIARRWEDVPLFQGDDAALIEELRVRYHKAKQDDRGRTGGRAVDASGATEARDALVAATEEAEPRATIIRVQALPRKVYKGLRLANPPREGNEVDAAYGFNRDDMADALIEYFNAESGEKTVISPDLGAKAEHLAWLEELTEGNAEALFNAAYACNEGAPVDPKAISALGSPET